MSALAEERLMLGDAKEAEALAREYVLIHQDYTVRT